jgi:ATP phosphoribosyltransferase regulatory subunit
MSAWVLPDHIADVLPSEARHIEELRRLCLDSARTFGYELIMPPLLEHLESLLSGSGKSLDLQTFKLIDQLSGRTMGVRADTTTQVARIDAHLLNRPGVTRLCYCGPVLHTRPSKPFATREPLQFGAEIYGHAGLEADLEVIELAMQCVSKSTLAVSGEPLAFQIDLGDARILPALLEGVPITNELLEQLKTCIAGKDTSGLRGVCEKLPSVNAQAIMSLLELYGDADVLKRGAHTLKHFPDALKALEDLNWIKSRLAVPVVFDLADVRGYSYYTGMRFGVYTAGLSDALIRGGRYDEVGAAFGRLRPAVGFSLDLKDWVQLLARPAARAAIKAPWSEDEQLNALIQSLRSAGETVLRVLPGQNTDGDEFLYDRELIQSNGAWVVKAISGA